LERKVQSLTLKLESQADYATIKKDLAILKVTQINTDKPAAVSRHS
jgi:hypothetical protein